MVVLGIIFFVQGRIQSDGLVSKGFYRQLFRNSKNNIYHLFMARKGTKQTLIIAANTKISIPGYRLKKSSLSFTNQRLKGCILWGCSFFRSLPSQLSDSMPESISHFRCKLIELWKDHSQALYAGSSGSSAIFTC